jgi:hypothetical protein
MSISDDPNITIISPDSPFVRAIIDASAIRSQIVQDGVRPPNAADTCHTDPAIIAKIANDAFWASLAVEEGRPIQGTLCAASPDEIPSALALSSPPKVSIDSIVALTTAAPKSRLAFQTGQSGDPEIWGLVDPPLIHTLQLRISSPGTVIASFNGDLVALVHNGQISTPQHANVDSWVEIVAKTFGSEAPYPDRRKAAAMLLRIVASMFHHGHGGALIVVPSASSDWHSDVNIKYEFSGIQGSDLLKQRWNELKQAALDADKLRNADLTGQYPEHIPATLRSFTVNQADFLQRRFTDTLRQVGNLTALDGAVIIDTDFALFGFGAKLRMPGPESNFNVIEIDVLDNSQKRVSHSQVGGTRHQSAAYFVNQHNDALAFVASQDGRLTLFVWASEEESVIALRNLHHMIWEYDSNG